MSSDGTGEVSGVTEPIFEEVNNYAHLVNRFHKRARHWSIGEASWLLEEQINGELIIGIKFYVGRECNEARRPNKLHVGQPAGFAKPDILDETTLDGRCNEPVFVQVVGCDYPPKKIAPSSSAILLAERLDVLHDDLFEVWVVSENLSKFFDITTLSLLRRFECQENLIGFFIERKHDPLITDTSLSGEGASEIIERRAGISQAIPDQKRDVQIHGDVPRRILRSIRCLKFPSVGGVRVILDQTFPPTADIVGVHFRSKKFAPCIIED